jgi:hypothetical protein
MRKAREFPGLSRIARERVPQKDLDDEQAIIAQSTCACYSKLHSPAL